MTESAWISPQRTLDSGYGFKFINLNNAIEHLLQKQNIPPGLIRKTLWHHWARLLGGHNERKENRESFIWHFILAFGILFYYMTTHTE